MQNAASSQTTSPPLVEMRDLAILGGLLALAPLAWLLPSRSWPGAASTLFDVATWVTGARARTTARIALMERATRDVPNAPDPSLLYRAYAAGRIEQLLQNLGEFRPGRWKLAIETLGREHLESGLRKGSGVVLWVGPLLFSDLVVKKALCAAGYPLTHLSRDTHGPSNTRLGRDLLNPVRVASERRYLRERLVMTDGSELKHLRQLERRLRENRAVSIRFGPHGQRRVEAPVMGGRIGVASGAASLALTTGAALLPVFALRTGPKAFQIRIDAPLEHRAGQSRRAAVEDLVRAYMNRVGSVILAHPTLFSGWRWLEVEGATWASPERT